MHEDAGAARRAVRYRHRRRCDRRQRHGTESGGPNGRLALLADIVVRPASREADFERVRQLRLHRLKQMRDLAAAVADRAFLKLIYADDPYGHAPIGTRRSLTSLTIDDVRQFHASAIRPEPRR